MATGNPLKYQKCSRLNSADHNERIMRAHRNYEAQLRRELDMESQIIDDDPYYIRQGTRLDRSRILETDEDNLY